MELNVFLAVVFLTICSITDIKKKQVSVMVCLLFVLTGLVFNVISMNELKEIRGLWKNLLFSMAPGVILFLLAMATKEKIGKGDGLVMIVMGILLGMERSVQILMLASLMSAFVAVLLIVVRKVRKNQEIPFVPFLAVGMCLMILGGL